MTSFKPLLVTTVLLIPGVAEAQEKYTIKFKEPGEGESSRIESKETMNMKTTISLEKQKDPMVQEMKANKHYVFTQTILERPLGAALPTKVKRIYEKAVNEQTGPYAKPQGPLPFHGKTVLIEKKGEKYEFRLEGGKVLDADIGDLQAEFDRNEGVKTKKALIPPGPVAINESWKFDPMEFGGDMGKNDKAAEVKSEGSAKLVKVYKKDGQLYGVIDAVMQIQMSKSVKAGAADNTSSESKVLFKLTFEGCIDGSVSAGSLRGTGDISNSAVLKDTQAGTVRSAGTATVTVENSWREAPKK